MRQVKEIADALGVTGTTIRNWSKDFAEYLGPAANPEPGKIRQFSEDDFRSLAAVANLKAQRFTHDEIKGKLEEATPEDLAEIPIPEPARRSPGTLEIPVLRIMDDLRLENQRLRQELIELERRCAKLEAQIIYHQKSLWQRIRGR